MSAELPPTEQVPLFNPIYFLGAGSPFTKEVADNLYLQYPVGQGTEIIPDLVVSGELQSGENILMTGTALTNFLEFPDGTQQFTAAVGVGATIDITDTNTNATFYPVFVDSAGTGKILRADTTTTAFSVNPNTGDFSVGSKVKITGVGGVFLGGGAGGTLYEPTSIAIGKNSGNITQGTNSVALGSSAGYNNQGNNCLAVGQASGQINQGVNATSLGNSAGSSNQGVNSVSIGNSAGNTTQGDYAVAIGDFAGGTTQGESSVAIGSFCCYWSKCW
jgi:hypothetical protein